MTRPNKFFASLQFAITVMMLVFVLVITGCVAARLGGDKPKIIDYGVYRARIYLPVSDATSPTGYTLPLGHEQLFWQLDEFYGDVGKTFGFRFYLPPSCTNDLHFIYKFPPITNPATGKAIDHVDELIAKPPKNGFMRMLYTFAESYEIVPGKWSFEVFSNGKLILEKDFQVSKKEPKPKSGS